MIFLMGDTPGRTLELLGLLQARQAWAGAELAERLEVSERTVRRDVDRLRSLGFPVDAIPGRYGGYSLGRGGSLPPLLLDDEETVTVAIGLRAAVDGTIEGLESSAVSVLAKLDKLVPTHLANRIRAIHDNTSSMSRVEQRERISASHLVLLTGACSNNERVRFDYVTKEGVATRRLVEPLQVVRTGPRWYLAAWDIDRKDWRTFRVDRIVDPENVKTKFEFTDPPDPVALIAAGLASVPFPVTARILMPLPLEEASLLVPRPTAIYEIEPGSTCMELGSTSLDRLVGYIAGLRPACEVLSPTELRDALTVHARNLAKANAAPPS